jgi:hypothetical protein
MAEIPLEPLFDLADDAVGGIEFAAEAAMRAHLVASRSNLMAQLRGAAGAAAVARG